MDGALTFWCGKRIWLSNEMTIGFDWRKTRKFRNGTEQRRGNEARRMDGDHLEAVIVGRQSVKAQSWSQAGTS